MHSNCKALNPKLNKPYEPKVPKKQNTPCKPYRALKARPFSGPGDWSHQIHPCELRGDIRKAGFSTERGVGRGEWLGA